MWRIVHLERTRFAKRYGRRGLLLLLSGLAWIGIGISTTRSSLERFSADGSGSTLLELMDKPWVGWLWTGCGLVAVITAMLRDRRIVSRHDAVGFNAILTPPITWFAGFVWSSIMYLATDGEEGRSSSPIAMIVWALVCLFIMTVAGWPEGPADTAPRRVSPPPPRDSKEVA